MPVVYVYEASDNVLYVRPYGTLTVPDVLHYLEDVINDQNISSPATEVVRFADVEEFHIAGIRDLPRMLPRLLDEKKLRATIFVTDSDVQFFIVRMMVMLLELQDAGYPTRVARSEDELQRELKQLTSE